MSVPEYPAVIVFDDGSIKIVQNEAELRIDLKYFQIHHTDKDRLIDKKNKFFKLNIDPNDKEKMMAIGLADSLLFDEIGSLDDRKRCIELLSLQLTNPEITQEERDCIKKILERIME